MGVFTVDGDGDIATVKDLARLHVDGTWGGGSIQWKYLALDLTFRPLAEGLKTADHDLSLPIKGSMQVRPTLTGSSGASLYYEAA